MTQYSIIHVWHGATEAWPIVERIPGGWRSGLDDYNDAEVLGVTALSLDAGEREALRRHVAAAGNRVDLLLAEINRLHAQIRGAA